ncbi:MAG TPA: hypothetical protein VKU02_01970 [Gemmataceae bacterium]|nr:hypothetical protein [Gemmataceae bacterium]
MLRTRCTHLVQPRRGVILVVVLALLTLFAVVGLSFAFYASAAAVASRNFREAESETQPDLDAELLFSYFLGQFVYDTSDDETGIYSGLRGHSLARNMYGLNYSKVPGGPIRYEDQGVPINQVPFNGTGRLHTKFPEGLLDAPGTYNNPFKIDDYKLINYTYHGEDHFLRDPERFGGLVRVGPKTEYRPYRTDPKYAAEEPGFYVGGFNAPYTYPDLNNMFLAAVKAGTGSLPQLGTVAGGTVLIPSFHRPWLFGSLRNRENPNWHNPEGKYKILRPRPVDQKHDPNDPDEAERFPYPEDEGGDVKNLIGSPGTLYLENGKPKLANNDSLWLDLDFPVMTAPDGRKFKALFAPLIMDLDNRVNLNVHGNLRGAGGADHASNQGWGAWEVSAKRVLDASPPEWQALFQTTIGPTGRYGRDNFPHSLLAPPTAGPYPKVYAPVDFDGSDQEHNGQPSAPLLLKPGGSSQMVPYQSFPDPPAGYSFGDKLDAERVHHPNLYNPFTPAIPDRSFALSNMEALLRYGDTGSPALTSELVRACPQNFADGTAAAARRRSQITLRSFDLDRPGITPWFWHGANGAEYNRWPLPMSVGTLFPCGYPIASPPFPRLFQPPSDSDFGPDWRAAARLTSLRRLDLNRYLPDYPKPNTAGVIEDLVQFEVAQRARQFMAAEIFEVLWRVTGAGNPADIASPPQSPANPYYPQWNAMRALAQLAVNIVDFIDSDDYITPFMWHPSGQWVFGTELPRVVLNEAYVQYISDLSETVQFAQHYIINAWVELLNPLLSNPSSPTQGQAKLGNGAYSIYRIVLCPDALGIRDAGNVLGDRPSLKTPGGQEAIVQFGDGNVIPPVGKNYAGNGFFVVGPQYAFDIGLPPGLPVSENPGIPLNLQSPQMNARVLAGAIAPITILLRRLACPNLPPQLDSTKPFYNPYLTVDYMENVPAASVLRQAEGATVSLQSNNRLAYGRKQPYAGHKAMLKATGDPGTPHQATHATFGRHNGGINPASSGLDPFDWLAHLDRKLVSPMELLHVSAFKPHELTQQFMLPLNQFQHRAPWFDEDLPRPRQPEALSHRLYRAFEFLGTRNQTVGMMAVSIQADGGLGPPSIPGDSTKTFMAQRFGTTATGGTWEIIEGSSLIIDKGTPAEEVVRVRRIAQAVPPNKAIFEAEFIKTHDERFTIAPTTISERVPGKININTIWDPEILLALCDPQSSNAFNETQIGTAIFNHLLNLRSKHGRPTQDDRPFRSGATGFYPTQKEIQFPGSSIDDTVLRAVDAVGQRLFQVPVNPLHPYLQYQLLNKIYNNITVRSNVFAVWLTVGFFEVTDDSSRPVKLGVELGRAENRQIRHRMFAIVDRSVLHNNPGPQPHFDPKATPSPGASTGMVVPYVSIIE